MWGISIAVLASFFFFFCSVLFSQRQRLLFLIFYFRLTNRSIDLLCYCTVLRMQGAARSGVFVPLPCISSNTTRDLPGVATGLTRNVKVPYEQSPIQYQNHRGSPPIVSLIPLKLRYCTVLVYFVPYLPRQRLPYCRTEYGFLMS